MSYEVVGYRWVRDVESADSFSTRDSGQRWDRRRFVDTLEKLLLLVVLSALVYRLTPGIRIAPFNALYLFAEVVVVLMVVFRRSTEHISQSPAEWFIAFAGTLLPLLVIDTNGPRLVPGGLLMVVGVIISTTAQLSLGRSFGIVAANRGVKTAGLYSLVRHPMYTGYLLTITGFLLWNPSSWNAGVYVVWLVCQLSRIQVEERVLSADPAYRKLKARVRYRLVPFVY